VSVLVRGFGSTGAYCDGAGQQSDLNQ